MPTKEQWAPSLADGPSTPSSQGAPATRDDAQRWLVEYATNRDARLRGDLLVHYERLALSLVHELATKRDSFEDLAQVARIGLLHAIDRFDPCRERPFVVFARATILGELKRHLRDRTWKIRPPRSLQENHLAVLRAADDLTQELGRSPLIADISRRTELTEEQVLEAMEAGQTNAVVSLNRVSPDGGEHDIGEDHLSFADVDNALLVSRLLARLPERDRQIVRMRFEEEMTQAQIGAALGLSQMSISRNLARALARLRSALNSMDACCPG